MYTIIIILLYNTNKYSIQPCYYYNYNTPSLQMYASSPIACKGQDGCAFNMRDDWLSQFDLSNSELETIILEIFCVSLTVVT